MKWNIEIKRDEEEELIATVGDFKNLISNSKTNLNGVPTTAYRAANLTYFSRNGAIPTSHREYGISINNS